MTNQENNDFIEVEIDGIKMRTTKETYDVMFGNSNDGKVSISYLIDDNPVKEEMHNKITEMEKDGGVAFGHRLMFGNPKSAKE